MSRSRIAAAQVASVRGDVHRNIDRHAEAIAAAARQEVSVLVFPELSLTGYEPELAGELAMSPADRRLAPLLALARRHQIDIVMGAPLQNGAAKPLLGAILATRDGATKTYAKMHLGGSEPDYFERGNSPLSLTMDGHTIGLAICADASSATHPQAYADAGATVYAAAVFLTAEWYVTDAPRLARHAARHRLLTLMANHAALVGAYEPVGKSAIWAPDGVCLAEAESTESALVIATETAGVWRGEVVRF